MVARPSLIATSRRRAPFGGPQLLQVGFARRVLFLPLRCPCKLLLHFRLVHRDGDGILWRGVGAGGCFHWDIGYLVSGYASLILARSR